jgi:5-carboxymethyl-2-hydroxymuconate isomerase
MLVRLIGAENSYRVGKVVGLGRNYADHVRELGNEMPQSPVLFMKPATSLIGQGGTVRIPAYSRECHYEAELAVLIGRMGKNIGAAEALEYVAGYGVAIDLTLRDVQDQQKKKGLPWEIAKGFDTACPLSDFVPAQQIADPHALRIRMRVNGEVRQDGSTALMLRRIPQIIGEISAIFTLEAGDVILTGTPAGVGVIVSGDALEAEIEGVGKLAVTVG